MVINTDDGEASAKEALQQTLNYRSTATIVLSGKPPGSLIEICLQSGQQVILINRMGQYAGADTIDIDYSTTMKEAFDQLIAAGCQHLAVVSSSARSPSMVIRETRFMQAAVDAKTDVSLIRPGSTSYQTGVLAARKLLSQPLRPDGVFCVTDLIACGFIDAARHEFGLRIPQDLCVIGFDDIEQASWLGYQLTTFSQPLAEMAQAACELLLSPDAQRPESRVFDARLVKRGRCAEAGFSAGTPGDRDQPSCSPSCAGLPRQRPNVKVEYGVIQEVRPEDVSEEDKPCCGHEVLHHRVPSQPLTEDIA